MSLATATSSAAAALVARPFVILDDRVPRRGDAPSDGGRLVFCPAALSTSDEATLPPVLAVAPLALAVTHTSSGNTSTGSTGSDPILAAASSSSSPPSSSASASSAAPSGITFQRFVCASSHAALVAFFRAALAEVERPPRAIVDYHLRIVRRDASQRQADDTRTNQKTSAGMRTGDARTDQTSADMGHEETQSDGPDSARPSNFAFAVEILYGAARPELRHFPVCISCDSANAVAVASLIRSTALTRCWLDAQARANFVVTPVRHVERLADFTDAELAALWTDAAQLLADETGDPNDAPFHSLIINHGTYRNLPHAHLKLRFDDAVFASAIQSRWDERRRAAVAQLVAFNADSELARSVIGGGRGGGGC